MGADKWEQDTTRQPISYATNSQAEQTFSIYDSLDQYAKPQDNDVVHKLMSLQTLFQQLKALRALEKDRLLNKQLSKV